MKRRRNVFRGNVLQVVFAWHGATVRLKIQPMKVAENYSLQRLPVAERSASFHVRKLLVAKKLLKITLQPARKYYNVEKNFK